MDIYIFLDIDGVLNIPSCMDGDTENWQFDSTCLTNLEKLTEAIQQKYQVQPKIIISSSWRTGDLTKTQAHLTNRGFSYAITGETIRAYQYIDRSKKIHLSIPRGVEIKQWIDTHIHSDNGKNWSAKNVGKDYIYLIIDDDTDMLLEQVDMFVSCNSVKGFTEHSCKIAMGKLSTQVDKANHVYPPTW